MARNIDFDASNNYGFTSLKPTVLDETTLKKEPEGKPEEAKAETKEDVKKEVKAEVNAEAKTETKTEVKTETKAITNTKVKPEQKTEFTISEEKEKEIINATLREINSLAITGNNIGTTQGNRSGKRLPQQSLRFSDANDKFVRYMARLKGMTITEYVNSLIDKERENLTEK